MSEAEALQTTLAAEHAAVFVYGVLGGRTSPTATPGLFDAISSAYAAHRARRDRLTRELTDLGETAVAAETAYQTPRPLDTAGQVARAALVVERNCATTYAWLVANTAGARRRRAIAALNEAAVRELVFRGTPEMFPGANEYADR
ncbi:ferritin-like domain-containing protein [Nocardioides hungaricus]